MYLLTIYRLNLEGERAGIARLASRLGVSAASSTEMIKKLSERGLEYVGYYLAVIAVLSLFGLLLLKSRDEAAV